MITKQQISACRSLMLGLRLIEWRLCKSFLLSLYLYINYTTCYNNNKAYFCKNRVSLHKLDYRTLSYCLIASIPSTAWAWAFYYVLIFVLCQLFSSFPLLFFFFLQPLLYPFVQPLNIYTTFTLFSLSGFCICLITAFNCLAHS